MPSSVFLGERAPRQLYEWAKRRHFVFLTDLSLITAILLAYLSFSLLVVSLWVSGASGCPLSYWHLSLGSFAVLLAAVLMRNWRDSLDEMKQFISLCFHHSEAMKNKRVDGGREGDTSGGDNVLALALEATSRRWWWVEPKEHGPGAPGERQGSESTVD